MKKTFLAVILIFLFSIPLFAEKLLGGFGLFLDSSFSFTSKQMFDSGFYPKNVKVSGDVISVQWDNDYDIEIYGEEITELVTMYNNKNESKPLIGIQLLYGFRNNSEDRCMSVMKNLFEKYDNLAQSEIKEDPLLQYEFTDRDTGNKVTFIFRPEESGIILSVAISPFSMIK